MRLKRSEQLDLYASSRWPAKLRISEASSGARMKRRATQRLPRGSDKHSKVDARAKSPLRRAVMGVSVTTRFSSIQSLAALSRRFLLRKNHFAAIAEKPFERRSSILRSY